MALHITERWDSRKVTAGSSPSAELVYTVEADAGEDEVTARVALEAYAPRVYQLYPDNSFPLKLDAVTISPLNDTNLWEATCQYGKLNEATYDFETGGGTTKILQSLATTRYAPVGKAAPDFKGAIGVSNDGVEGVDITVPAFTWVETLFIPSALVTGAYKSTLAVLTGKVNTGPFRGFDGGEVLFMGASGKKNTFYGEWEITYKFAASRNTTGMAIGAITGIAKKGWEYLWVRYQDSEDTLAKAVVKTPIAVYVEQVYETADFGQLGIGVA